MPTDPPKAPRLRAPTTASRRLSPQRRGPPGRSPSPTYVPPDSPRHRRGRARRATSTNGSTGPAAARACSAPRSWRRWTTTHPDDEAITLAVAKRPASAEPSAGSLFINPGGPGGPGVDYVGLLRGQGAWSGSTSSAGIPRGTGRLHTGEVRRRQGDGRLHLHRHLTGRRRRRSGRSSRRRSTSAGAAWSGPGPCWSTSPPPRRSATSTCCATWWATEKLTLLRILVRDQDRRPLRPALPRSGSAGWCWTGRSTSPTSKDVSQLDGFERALGNFAAWCAGRKCKLGDTKAEVLEPRSAICWRRLDAKPINGGRAG